MFLPFSFTPAACILLPICHWAVFLSSIWNLIWSRAIWPFSVSYTTNYLDRKWKQTRTYVLFICFFVSSVSSVVYLYEIFAIINRGFVCCCLFCWRDWDASEGNVDANGALHNLKSDQFLLCSSAPISGSHLIHTVTAFTSMFYHISCMNS